MIRNTILILLLILLGLSCSDKYAPDIEIPQVKLFSEEGIRLLKQYALEIDSIIQKHKEEYLDDKRDFDIYVMAMKVKKLDGVKRTTVDKYQPSSIFVEYKNGLFLDCLVVGIEEIDIVGDGKNEDRYCYYPKPLEEPIMTPLGKKAVILAPFQKDFEENITLIEKYLNEAGFEVDIYTDEKVTTEMYKGSFLKQYDMIYISSRSTDRACCLTAIEFTKDTKSGITPVAFRGKIYESYTFLRDSTDTPFPSSVIYHNAVGIPFYQEAGVGAILVCSSMINIETTKEISEKVFQYLSEGYEISKIKHKICSEEKLPHLDDWKADSALPFYLVEPTGE